MTIYVLRFRFGRIDHKGRNRKRWGDKAGNVDEPVEAENESDLVCDWIVKGKQESDDRYAVVARSRTIQSNGGPSNGPASRCRHARRLALVRAVLRAPRPRGAGCGGNFCALRTLLSPIVKRSIVPTGLSAGTSGARPSSFLRVRFFSTFAVTPIRVGPCGHTSGAHRCRWSRRVRRVGRCGFQLVLPAVADDADADLATAATVALERPITTTLPIIERDCEMPSRFRFAACILRALPPMKVSSASTCPVSFSKEPLYRAKRIL